MLVANGWNDFELIDAGNGEKLERWGEYILRRPDPQAIWKPLKSESIWEKADAFYRRSSSGGGAWEYKKKIAINWQIAYKKLTFSIQPMGFKHTGLFPEQAANWDFMIEKIKKSNSKVKVLNLFAYTGGATTALAYAGAEVCHVDASKGMVGRAKDNLRLSGLENKKVRFIVDDVIKFVRKEKRRANVYDAIIMDPPSYGRGPKGEMWEIEDLLFDLVRECVGLLSNKPLFFIVNSYASGFSAKAIENILRLTISKKYKGNLSSGEIGLPVCGSDVVLPCGIYARWER